MPTSNDQIPYLVLSAGLIQFMDEEWLNHVNPEQEELDDEIINKHLHGTLELYEVIRKYQKTMLQSQWETILYNMLDQIFSKKYGMKIPTKSKFTTVFRSVIKPLMEDPLLEEIKSLKEELKC